MYDLLEFSWKFCETWWVKFAWPFAKPEDWAESFGQSWTRQILEFLAQKIQRMQRVEMMEKMNAQIPWYWLSNLQPWRILDSPMHDNDMVVTFAASILFMFVLGF